MGDDERRGQYLDLLLSMAHDAPDPDLLDRIERVLGIGATLYPAAREARKPSPYLCPTCGGRKSFYAEHCRNCNKGTPGNAGGAGGDTRSTVAREAVLQRNNETAAIRDHIEDRARVLIGEPRTVDVAALPRSLRADLSEALKSQNGHALRTIVKST